MRTNRVSSRAICLALLLFAAAPQAQALAAAKYFRVTSDHFRDFAAKAADLYFKTENPAEKHLLNHLSSVASIYAEKAGAIMHLVEVLEHMSAKRDKVYVQERVREARREQALPLPQDIKLLTDLVEAQENQAIRSLGNLIVNEMRVFERNIENL